MEDYKETFNINLNPKKYEPEDDRLYKPYTIIINWQGGSKFDFTAKSGISCPEKILRSYIDRLIDSNWINLQIGKNKFIVGYYREEKDKGLQVIDKLRLLTNGVFLGEE